MHVNSLSKREVVKVMRIVRVFYSLLLPVCCVSACAFRLECWTGVCWTGVRDTSLVTGSVPCPDFNTPLQMESVSCALPILMLIFYAHDLMVICWMVLGEVVCIVAFAWSPYDFVLFLVATV